MRFAAIGALGTVVNLALTAGLISTGVHYVLASLVGAEVTIVGNFMLQERLVFDDLRGGRPAWARAGAWLAYNNGELALRTPLLVLAVRTLHTGPLAAQAVLLLAAFGVRFTFARLVLYRRRPTVLTEPTEQTCSPAEWALPSSSLP